MGNALSKGRDFYVFWQELKPIERRMTAEDKAWFSLFLKAFYLHNEPALHELTKDEAVFTRFREASLWNTNEARRNGPAPVRTKRMATYSADDWDHSDSDNGSAEDAIIAAIDHQRREANAKARKTKIQG